MGSIDTSSGSTGSVGGTGSLASTVSASSGSSGSTGSSVSMSATSVGTTTGSSSSNSTGTTVGSTTGTSGGTTTGTPGGAASGHESWAWLYVDYAASLAAIAANPGSFTHVSPTLYTVNYAYESGVAAYTNCTNGPICTDQGSNNFDGFTTQQVAAQINALGLATVPAIYGGADNSGVDVGIQNILNDTNGAQTSFITSMVAEAVANGYAGYNLDWEVGAGVDGTYAVKFVSFVNAFKGALAQHQMSLSADAIVSNINGTWCSGNSGYLDFGLLSASAIDRIIIEDYTASLGSPSTSCQAAVLSTANPIGCPLNSSGSDVTFTGLLDFMCSNLPAQMVVVGVESISNQTNPIAGQAISAMESYGIDKVAVWPQFQGQDFLSSQGLVAPQPTWYQLLAAFLKGA
jgi:hypothetical protein